MGETPPWDKTAGDARTMSGCCAIHYSEACGHTVHGCTRVLFEMTCYCGLEPFWKICFCKTWRRGTCLSCIVIVWKSTFMRLVQPIKYGVFYASISMGIFVKWLLLYSAVLHEIQQEVRWPCQSRGEEWLQSLWAGQGQQWKGHEFYMLHIINTHIWSNNSAAVSVHQRSAWGGRGEQSVHPCFYPWNQNTVTSNHMSRVI